MIEQLLEQLGLTPKEIQVYLAVLKTGKISPAQVAKATKINRTTVYSLAKDLINRGIITEDLGSSTRYLLALPPGDLMQIVRREERELEKKKRTIQSAIGELQSIAESVKYAIPKITFIGEEDLELHLYKQSEVWNKSAIARNEPAYWGFQDPSLLHFYGEWIHWYWKQPGSAKMLGKLLTHQSKFEDEISEKKYANRHIKFWEPGKEFSATTWVIGDYLVMVMTAHHPHYLVEIHDVLLAHNMRTMFKGIWENIQ